MSNGPDFEWIKDQLSTFIAQTQPRNLSGVGFITTQMGSTAPSGEVIAQAEIVERILDRFYPEWKALPNDKNYEWAKYREAAQRCLARIERQDELREKLGEAGPSLTATNLHATVWRAASSLWDNGHYREAVEAAAKSVNAFTQTKVGRRDVSESDLFNQCFSDDTPGPGKPRLRHPDDDGGKSAKSLRRGIRDFANGCYAALRNPAAHGDPEDETPEHEALEQLAAFSILARWVQASVVKSS